MVSEYSVLTKQIVSYPCRRKDIPHVAEIILIKRKINVRLVLVIS